MVQAFQEVAAVIGALIELSLGPVSKKPWLFILFACLSASMALRTMLFWIMLRGGDALHEGIGPIDSEEGEGCGLELAGLMQYHIPHY